MINLDFTPNRNISFKDKKFCSFYKNCKKGNNCKNALTERVVKEAYSFRTPIAKFDTPPEHCFEKK